MIKISFIGAGRMTQAFLKGLSSSGDFDMSSITLCSKSGTNLQELSQQYGVLVAQSNIACAQSADMLILAVKPQQLQSLIEEIRAVLKPNVVVISIAAAIQLESLEAWFQAPIKLIRWMPNTAISIHLGSIAICHNTWVTDVELKHVIALFKPLGTFYPIIESQFDAFIAASGSGIAFAYQVMDDFIHALPQENLNTDIHQLVLETFKAAAEMALNSHQTLQERINEVCSKGGTTVEGIQVLRNKDLVSVFQQTFDATIQRSIALSQELGHKK